MKIVLIDKEEFMKIGGIGIYTQRLYEYLTDKKHEVYILRFAKEPSSKKYIFNIPYYYAEPRSYIFLPSEKTVSMARSFLSKVTPDIVYINIGISPLDFLLPSVGKQLKIPVTGVWHGDFNETLSSIQILTKSLFLAYLPFCKQLDLLHVFSAKLKNFYTSKGIDPQKIIVLPNGVNQTLYSPGKSLFKETHKIKTGILFLGRITLVKNPELLISSFLSLNPEVGTKLVIVGHGELETPLREKYKDNKNIIFTGLKLAEKEKIDIIRACDIFVLPSRFEGMSLALLESMSCGLACITSDVGANGELVKSAGIMLSASRLKSELPLLLKLLLENPELIKVLGKKARQKVLTCYTQKIIFDRLESMLEKTIANYQKYGSTSNVFDWNKNISQRLKKIWQRTQSLGSSLFD